MFGFYVLKQLKMLFPRLCSFLFPQPKLYKSVIDDVINEVRELFLDEGVDEQVLLELKTVHDSTIVYFFVNTHSRWEMRRHFII